MSADDRARWTGRALAVEVLCSRPGLAQQILVASTETDRALLVDAGDGCLRDILATGRDLRSLSGLVVTHGHFDHMGGLHALLGFLRMIGRAEPLPVIGPRGCTELWSTIDTFLRCYPDDTPFEIVRVELGDGEETTVDDLAVRACAVHHCGSIAGGRVLGRIPALGYRITRAGESVAITGDTGTDADLASLVADADLALIEATMPRGREVEPEVLSKVHLRVDEAEALGALAKKSLLIHRSIGSR
jgi:ribonuclease BN (tRNA processing enzyme)